MRLVAARSRRSTVILYGEVDINGFVLQVRVRNLSPSGAQMDRPGRLTPGARFGFSCKGARPVMATIAWVRGDRCGIVFDTPLKAPAT